MLINLGYESEFTNLINHLKYKYPSKLFDLEGIGYQLNLCEFSKSFFSAKTTADISVDPNSNIDEMSVIAYDNEVQKGFQRLNSLYLIWKEMKRLYSKEEADKIVEIQIIGDSYINDMTGINKPYCYNFSTFDVMLEGLPYVNKIKSEPPKHLSSFLGQLSNFATYASNSVLGAVGLADLLIVSSWYVDKMFKENIHQVPAKYILKQIKQELQQFIYFCNQPFRGGIQSGFYNVGLYDSNFLDKMCAEYTFIDGTHPTKTTVEMLQTMFINLHGETLRKTTFTFPVLTACMSVDDDKNILDEYFFDEACRANLEFGQINFYYGKTSTLSSCCRLRSDTKNEYFNQFGAGGSKIGSLGVVTLNLPRIAYSANKSKEVFFENLTEIAEAGIKVNNVKRHILKKRIASGSLPLYTLGFMSIDTQYSTLGINGVNEACEIMDLNILTEEGQKFVIETLNLLNKLNDKAAKKYHAPHNLEQTPSENSAIKLADKDKLLGYQDQYDLYSNQFIPLTVNANLLDRIHLQGLFDSHMTGGAIAHLNVETKITNVEKMKKLLTHAAKKGVIYTAINYNLQRCEKQHISVGKSDKCSICNSNITDNFTRVVGYLVNTKNFHRVRREVDYPNRVFYKGGEYENSINSI